MEHGVAATKAAQNRKLRRLMSLGVSDETRMDYMQPSCPLLNRNTNLLTLNGKHVEFIDDV